MENSGVELCKQTLKYEELEKILRIMVSKSATELCNELKSEMKKNPSSDGLMKPKILISIHRPDNSEVVGAVMDERKHTGRKMKNHVMGEKVVCFKLPDDFDVETIQDIDKIKERLGKWRLQRRQRETKMKDTSSQKRSASDDLASTSSKAMNTTEAMEPLTIIEPSNKQNQTLERNFGPTEKIATREEAVQKFDDDDHESDHFKQN